MPYMTNGKRDYKKEDKWDASHKDPRGLSRADARQARHTARAELTKIGQVHKGDGKQVDHTKPLGMGGSKTAKGNLRVVTAKANESFRRNAKGGIVSQTSKKEAKGRGK